MILLVEFSANDAGNLPCVGCPGSARLRQQMREGPSADGWNPRRTPQKTKQSCQAGRGRNQTTGRIRAPMLRPGPAALRSTGRPENEQYPPPGRGPRVRCSTSRRRAGCLRTFPSCSRSAPADDHQPKKRSRSGWTPPSMPWPAPPRRADGADGMASSCCED